MSGNIFNQPTDSPFRYIVGLLQLVNPLTPELNPYAQRCVRAPRH
jgi:hypothetical protein